MDLLRVFLVSAGEPLQRSATTSITGGVRVEGQEGAVELRAIESVIELRVNLALYVGQPGLMFDAPDPGSSDMEWWAELSDAAEDWEALGFDLEQPGRFDETEDGNWYYSTDARCSVTADGSGVDVLHGALRLAQTLLP